MKEQRVFKCVPLEIGWTLAGTKHDFKAMYRRPRRSVGEYDEITQDRGPDGLPLYDLCGPLPLRRHSDWTAKGFEYVTIVASPNVEGSGWPHVAASLRAKSLNPQEYLQHPNYGTWNPKLYLATAGDADRAKIDALVGMVEQFGSDAVVAIRRADDPTFTLPLPLQGVPAGGKVLLNQAGAPVTGTEEVPSQAPVAADAVPAGGSAAKRVAAQKKHAAKKASPEVPA